MRAANGDGLFGRPALWEIAKDVAAEELEKVASGARPWSILAWVPLMAGADQETIIARWREALEAVVTAARSGRFR